MSSTETTPAAPIERPGLARRMAAFMYEGVLLFGVVFVAGYFFSAMTQQRHAMQGQHALQAFLFAVLGIYFAWFWSRGGQ
ncbi:MAG: RDD family protein, partial [Burkholderiaceae bacterium]|nr:RDD family protein [Burkholderiaceae bacterium]